jgi:hypothetical protein
MCFCRSLTILSLCLRTNSAISTQREHATMQYISILISLSEMREETGLQKQQMCVLNRVNLSY